MTCQYAHLGGAYVLGSLAASERAAYERHLPDCAECSRVVREFAGLPGLMGRVPLEALEPPGEPEPVPETLLPAVVSEVRRTQRRRRSALAATLVAAAAIVVVGVTGVVVTSRDGVEPPAAGPTTSQTTAPAERMDSLGAGSVTGWVSLTERPWGTRLDLTCTYLGDGSAGGWTSYAMVVRSVDGRVEQVGTWRAEAGRQVHVTLATALAPEDIESVVVRTDEGASVLRLAE